MVEQQLAAVGNHQRPAPPATTTLTFDEDGALGALAHAKRLYAARRKRNHAFAGYDLFGEPCWDILLDLFIAGEERNLIGVSSACIAACWSSSSGQAIPETRAASMSLCRRPARS